MDKASLESQLKSAPCTVTDTEEMFWLRNSDDSQSKIALGHALVGQYRFLEAVEAYKDALKVRQTPYAYLCLAGASLTLFKPEETCNALQKAMECGYSEKQIALQMGALHYFQGDYEVAAQWFLKCLPCDDETHISVLYWHLLSARKAGIEPSLKSTIPNLSVHHHTAYQKAVELLTGERTKEEMQKLLAPAQNDLDYVILAYALLSVLPPEEAAPIRASLLQRRSVWPSIAYLACYWETEHK